MSRFGLTVFGIEAKSRKSGHYSRSAFAACPTAHPTVASAGSTMLDGTVASKSSSVATFTTP